MNIKFSTWEEDDIVFNCSEVDVIYPEEACLKLKNGECYSVIGPIRFIE